MSIHLSVTQLTKTITEQKEVADRFINASNYIKSVGKRYYDLEIEWDMINQYNMEYDSFVQFGLFDGNKHTIWSPEVYNVGKISTQTSKCLEHYFTTDFDLFGYVCKNMCMRFGMEKISINKMSIIMLENLVDRTKVNFDKSNEVSSSFDIVYNASKELLERLKKVNV